MQTRMASMYLSLSDVVMIKSLSEELLGDSYVLLRSSLLVVSLLTSFGVESTLADDSFSVVISLSVKSLVDSDGVSAGSEVCLSSSGVTKLEVASWVVKSSFLEESPVSSAEASLSTLESNSEDEAPLLVEESS